MDIRLLYMELPTVAESGALDRKLKKIADVQEPLDGGKRLWITRIPETIYRPFATPKPFDILVGVPRLGDTQIEEYRMEIGTAPKRYIDCRSYEESSTAIEVLTALAREIMACTHAFMRIDRQLFFRLAANFSREKCHSEFLDDSEIAAILQQFPGKLAEIAHEKENGDLVVEWIVDAHWLQAWCDKMHRPSPEHGQVDREAFSRFASLDYF